MQTTFILKHVVKVGESFSRLSIFLVVPPRFLVWLNRYLIYLICFSWWGVWILDLLFNCLPFFWRSFHLLEVLLLFWGGDELFELLLPRVFGCSFLGLAWVFAFQSVVVLVYIYIYIILMAPSLCPPLVWNTPCPHCFGLYTLGGLSKHVKNAHPLAGFVS
jgi:hypothetical protein